MKTKGKLRINTRKEQVIKDSEKWKSAKTVKEKNALIGKYMGWE